MAIAGTPGKDFEASLCRKKKPFKMNENFQINECWAHHDIDVLKNCKATSLLRQHDIVYFLRSETCLFARTKRLFQPLEIFTKCCFHEQLYFPRPVNENDLHVAVCGSG